MVMVMSLKNLKTARVLNGYQQAQVANILGINRVSYARYESGEREPDISTICLLSDVLAVPVDFIIGRKPFNNWDRVMENKGIILKALSKFMDDSSHMDDLSFIYHVFVFIDSFSFSENTLLITFKKPFNEESVLLDLT